MTTHAHNKDRGNQLLKLEVTIASEVLPWVFETKTKYNHLLIPLGQVV